MRMVTPPSRTRERGGVHEALYRSHAGPGGETRLFDIQVAGTGVRVSNMRSIEQCIPDDHVPDDEVWICFQPADGSAEKIVLVIPAEEFLARMESQIGP